MRVKCASIARRDLKIHRRDQKGARVAAIRPKIRFWRAPMRRERAGHENFFIAKACDSESTRAAFGRRR
jgi:hypothetical protein